MSEDQQTAPSEEPTTTQEPGGAGTSAEVDYQKRYDDLRPQYDRTQSELTQLRQWQEAVLSDDEAFVALAAQRGFEIDAGEGPTDDPADEFADPRVSALEQKLAAIEQQNQQAEVARQVQEVEAVFERSFATIGAERGKPLSEKEQEVVKSYALLNDLAPEDAYKTLTGLYESQMEDWAATKKTSHLVSATGGEGTQQPNMDDEQERQAWMAARLQALNEG